MSGQFSNGCAAIVLAATMAVGCTRAQPSATEAADLNPTVASGVGTATGMGTGAEAEPVKPASPDQVSAGARALRIVDAPRACAGIDRDGRPADQVREMFIEPDGAMRVITTTTLPPDAFSAGVDPPSSGPRAEAPATRDDKIHPVLREWLRDRTGLSPTQVVTVVIAFTEDLQIPRFPQAPGDPAAQACADALVAEIERVRDSDYAALAGVLTAMGDVTMVDTDPSDDDVDFGFWLNRAVVVRVPLGLVGAIADRSNVVYVQPDNAHETPPRPLPAALPQTDLNLLPRAVELVGAHTYAGFRQPGTIAVFDTGVRFDHGSFDGTDMGIGYDCVAGSAKCTAIPGPGGFNPEDTCWDHGTGSAHILAGKDGLTDMRLNSMRIYSTAIDGNVCIDEAGLAGAEKAFQAAIQAQAHVILVEAQDSGSDVSLLSLAADSAFDAGRPVIAPVGNVDALFNLDTAAPANAHKVIGVGGFDVAAAAKSPIQEQRLGPAPDGRVKPDLLAPTNVRVASIEAADATRLYEGTSGAAPFGAGAAALVWNRLGGTGTDPGLVYAHMILAGQVPRDVDVDGFRRDTGAGPLLLPQAGRLWDGKVALSQAKSVVDIPLAVVDTPATLDAAIWWDEVPRVPHVPVDLAVIAPDGKVLVESTAELSVFQRVGASIASGSAGTWTIRIRGSNVDANGQIVYWAAHAADAR